MLDFDVSCMGFCVFKKVFMVMVFLGSSVSIVQGAQYNMPINWAKQKIPGLGPYNNKVPFNFLDFMNNDPAKRQKSDEYLQKKFGPSMCPIVAKSLFFTALQYFDKKVLVSCTNGVVARLQQFGTTFEDLGGALSLLYNKKCFSLVSFALNFLSTDSVCVLANSDLKSKNISLWSLCVDKLRENSEVRPYVPENDKQIIGKMLSDEHYLPIFWRKKLVYGGLEPQQKTEHSAIISAFKKTFSDLSENAYYKPYSYVYLYRGVVSGAICCLRKTYDKANIEFLVGNCAYGKKELLSCALIQMKKEGVKEVNVTALINDEAAHMLYLKFGFEPSKYHFGDSRMSFQKSLI